VPRARFTAVGRGLLALAALLPTASAPGGSREVELGVENFYYRTTQTPLNRDNRLGLDRYEDLLRGTLSWKETAGPARGVFRGYLERTLGGEGDETRIDARQAYLQYGFGPGLSLRVGKQRISWGSGFAWNPTNRVEPPKNPFNTSLEQEGVLAARVDLQPAAWAGVILVAARGGTQVGDLPFGAANPRRATAAVRARFLVKDTDLALVVSGGDEQRTLLGLDVARDLAPEVSAHAEAAFYRGAELGRSRDAETFFRLAAGALWSRGDTALTLEYFFNGEGLSAAELDAYLGSLAGSYAAAADPRLPGPVREQALRRYLAESALPYSGGLGLRRHYLQAAWTRSRIRGEWTAALRGVAGLSDGSIALTPGLGYAPRGDLTLSVDAVLLLGPAESEYRLAPVRGAVQARVKLLF
jgi:hypothetical protein